MREKSECLDAVKISDRLAVANTREFDIDFSALIPGRETETIEEIFPEPIDLVCLVSCGANAMNMRHLTFTSSYASRN